MSVGTEERRDRLKVAENDVDRVRCSPEPIGPTEVSDSSRNQYARRNGRRKQQADEAFDGWCVLAIEGESKNQRRAGSLDDTNDRGAVLVAMNSKRTWVFDSLDERVLRAPYGKGLGSEHD